MGVIYAHGWGQKLVSEGVAVLESGRGLKRLVLCVYCV